MGILKVLEEEYLKHMSNQSEVMKTNVSYLLLFPQMSSTAEKITRPQKGPGCSILSLKHHLKGFPSILWKFIILQTLTKLLLYSYPPAMPALMYASREQLNELIYVRQEKKVWCIISAIYI